MHLFVIFISFSIRVETIFYTDIWGFLNKYFLKHIQKSWCQRLERLTCLNKGEEWPVFVDKWGN